MQAELHGVHVTETGAAFSSRFHAATHTPGIRVHPVRKKDLGDAWLLDLIERSNPGLKRDGLVPGELVQMDGGELFSCCAADGVATVHADINAAQNMQRRFFTRHVDAFRIVARKVRVDGADVWVPRSMGKRLLGALGSHGKLVPTGHESGSCRFEKLTAREWGRLSGEKTADDESVGSEEEEILASLEEEALEQTGEVIVFFRDPSGVVLPRELWYPLKVFWGIVKTTTLARLRA